MAEVDWDQTLFTFIMHAGEARTLAKEAAEHAGAGQWADAEASMTAAEAEQVKAHEINANLIKMEAAGNTPPFSILLVHAMDLLLLAWSEMDFTRQYIAVCQRLAALEEEAAAWRQQAAASADDRE